jgi:glycosyltransferase involved in cell wall biosynthesis
VKIVQLLPELNEGGVERGTVELSREFVKKGHESFVISSGGKLVTQLQQEGAKHIQYDICSKNPLTALFRVFGLRKLLKQIDPDIIHARSRVPAWLAYLANKSLKIPFVTTVHGLNSVSKYSEIMTKGDKVICVSEVVKSYVMKHYEVSEKKLTVIQRGVDLGRFNLQSVDGQFIDEFIKKYDLNDRFVVSSIGRVTWLKDYETFIKAIAIAKKKIPNIVGLIVGGVREDKKEYASSLQDLATSLGVVNDVKFVGSQSKIVEVYALSAVVVNASLKMGNVGRTVIEALALNTPVIATTYEGLNNIIKDGVNGFVIETKNENALARAIERSRETTFNGIVDTIPKEFTLAHMVEATIEVYENAI